MFEGGGARVIMERGSASHPPVRLIGLVSKSDSELLVPEVRVRSKSYKFR